MTGLDYERRFAALDMRLAELQLAVGTPPSRLLRMALAALVAELQGDPLGLALADPAVTRDDAVLPDVRRGTWPQHGLLPRRMLDLLVANAGTVVTTPSWRCTCGVDPATA